MKSVLFITRKLQSAPGGMQTQTRILLNALQSRDDIHLTVLGYGGGPALLPLFILRATLTCLFTRAKTVHAGDGLLTVLFPVLAAFRPHRRRTVTAHGLDVSWSPRWYRALIRSALYFADSIAAVSRSTETIITSFGIPRERITVIPCAMHPADCPPSPKKNQILLLGRLVRRKGAGWFIRHVVPRLDPAMHVVIAGDGPERQTIESSPSPRVTVLGEVTEEKKRALLLESRLLVAPNIDIPDDPEGFGLVCLEAAAHGLPTVAARLQGLPDAVQEGVTGLFFTAGSADDAVRAIDECLRSEWSTDAMHAALRASYDPSGIASRYVHDIF
jgi:phosphatidyl-myo-inositol dimannoside synthase